MLWQKQRAKVRFSDVCQRLLHTSVLSGFGYVSVKTNSPEKFSAACMLFGLNGDVLADYRKIHMFDVSVNDNTGSYRESATTEAGSKVVTVETPIGNIGLAVCYDVRFQGYLLQWAISIFWCCQRPLPTHRKARWRHALLQARAIEKQCFVVAANQSGVHANGRETYGHSLVLSPWGRPCRTQNDEG